MLHRTDIIAAVSLRKFLSAVVLVAVLIGFSEVSTPLQAAVPFSGSRCEVIFEEAFRRDPKQLLCRA